MSSPVIVSMARTPSLNLELDCLNVSGGAITIGHPFGSTGTRLLSTMINSLRERDRSTGLITLRAAGSQGMALVVERLP